MNDTDSVMLSVRAEARQLVAPDYAVLDGLIEHTAESKAEAARSLSASLDRLTADLAARGAVPFNEGAGRRPLSGAERAGDRPSTSGQFYPYAGAELSTVFAGRGRASPAV